jgi:hypothetical protein
MTLIGILLVLAVVVGGAYVLRFESTNRSRAIGRLAVAGLLAFAGYAMIRPADVDGVAVLVGVARGSDLVLYLLVLGAGLFAASTYARFRELERRFAKLARSIALAEAERDDRPPFLSGPGRAGSGPEPAA